MATITVGISDQDAFTVPTRASGRSVEAEIDAVAEVREHLRALA
jgi:hypothetical protein